MKAGLLPNSVLKRLLLIFACLAVAPAEACPRQFEVLDPRTYSSPDGRFVLTVDPTDRHGAGPAKYVCKENGEQRWAKTLPWTLWDAGVTDDGIVAGYAYTRGASSIGDVGDFVVAIVDRDGEIRLKDSKPREHSQFFHQQPNPAANGLLVDQLNDRMVVRISDPDINRGHESWWVYRLSNAKALKQLVPVTKMDNPDTARFVLDAKPLAGTPLTLVHWWLYDLSISGQVGARFTLVDLDANPVWKLDLPADYSVRGDEAAEDKIRTLVRKRGGILEANNPGRFDVWVASKSLRKTFSVEQVKDNWRVRKVSESPHEMMATSKSVRAEIPTQQLKLLSSVELKSGSPSPVQPIRKVREFSFDGDGNIAFLRVEKKTGPVFVLTNQAGELLHEIPIDIKTAPESHWTGCAWVGGTRFVLTHSKYGVGAVSRAWWLDTKTRKLEPIPRFDCPPVERLVGIPDGGFVAFANMRHKYTMTPSLIAFDKSGRRLWDRPDDWNNNGKNALFSVKDIALTSRNEIVVLENTRKTVKVFDRQGELLRKFDLAKAWKREPSYPSRIASDIDGGFIVQDFDGSPPFVRMKHDGSVRSELAPKYSDGRTVDTLDGIQSSPDGRLWTSDGECLIRLNDNGTVDLTRGKAPDANELHDVGLVTVDGKGQIYALDRRSGAIHVFDKRGKPMHACVPRPNEFSKAIYSPVLAIDPGGNVFLGLGNKISVSEKPLQFACFSAQGERADDVALPNGQLHFLPDTDDMMVMRYEDILILDQERETKAVITRQPDGKWLTQLSSVAVGPNGTFAVLSNGSVNLYDSNGAPIRTIVLPKAIGNHARLAYDGSRILIAGACGLLMLDKTGATKTLLQVEQWKDGKPEYCTPLLVPEDNTVLVFNHDRSMLQRYAIQ